MFNKELSFDWIFTISVDAMMKEQVLDLWLLFHGNVALVLSFIVLRAVSLDQSESTNQRLSPTDQSELWEMTNHSFTNYDQSQVSVLH